MQADADNIDAASAILSGLKLRHETTGQVPYLIHTVCTMSPTPLISMLISLAIIKVRNWWVNPA